MKHIFTLLLLAVVITQPVRSQDRYDVLLSREWGTSETKSVGPVHITRLAGFNNYATITNITYNTVAQSIDEAIANAKEKGKSEKEIAQDVALYKNHAKGGVLYLYARRAGIEWADTENFSVEIMDSTETKIIFKEQYESKLPDHEANEPEIAPWRTLKVSWIDKELPRTFIVYVNDNYKMLNRYKFLVRVSQ